MPKLLSSQKKYIDFISNNISDYTHALFFRLNRTFKVVNPIHYNGDLKVFVDAFGFGDVSTILAPTRHSALYQFLRDRNIPVDVNKSSDLLISSDDEESTEIEIKDLLIEVKGAATAKSEFPPSWQSGKTHSKYEESRLFLLSQEVYDINKDELIKLRLVIVDINSDFFRDTGSTTNRTTLSYKTLEKEGLIINQYEINTTI